MKLKDMIPFVLHALNTQGETKQVLLTQFVAGTSGKNSPKLTQTLFPFMVAEGHIIGRKVGRSMMFRITERGQARLARDPLDEETAAWYRDHIQMIIQEG